MFDPGLHAKTALFATDSIHKERRLLDFQLPLALLKMNALNNFGVILIPPSTLSTTQLRNPSCPPSCQNGPRRSRSDGDAVLSARLPNERRHPAGAKFGNATKQTCLLPAHTAPGYCTIWCVCVPVRVCDCLLARVDYSAKRGQNHALCTPFLRARPR